MYASRKLQGIIRDTQKPGHWALVQVPALGEFVASIAW